MPSQYGRLLPTVEQTLFLRACLLDGDLARGAWSRWLQELERTGSSRRRALAAVGALLPLLSWNLERNGIDVESGVGTVVRSAQLTEELRWRSYSAICRTAFELLHGAGFSFIALKGTALGQLTYPLPTLRHTGDVDVLMATDDLQRAADLLTRNGWRESLKVAYFGAHHHIRPLVHPSRLPLELHRRLLLPFYTLPADDLWSRSRPARLFDVDVRVLAPSDNLLHACAHAMTSEPNLRWVADAWFLLDRHRDLSWDRFASAAVSARLELPLFLALSYLKTEIGVDVPGVVLADLERGAMRTGARGRSILRRAGRPWPLGTARQILGGPGTVADRVGALCRRAFPPPLEVASYFDIPIWRVPAFYVWRTARYVGFVSSTDDRSEVTSASAPATRPAVSRTSPPRSSQ
jgi:hypothetical protein